MVQFPQYQTTFTKHKKKLINLLVASLCVLNLSGVLSEEQIEPSFSNDRYKSSKNFKNTSRQIQPVVKKLGQYLHQMSWDNPMDADGFLVHKDLNLLMEVKQSQATLFNYDRDATYTVASYRNGIISESSLPAIYLQNRKTGHEQKNSQAHDYVFEGAEGFGTKTIAGKFGSLCTVVNKKDSGSGSLRDCVEQSFPRRIEFLVSGTITLNSTLKINNPFISIIGQSSPLDGILLTLERNIDGPVVHVATHDVLIQHLRIRAGEAHSHMQTCCRDSLRIGSKKPDSVYNVVIDHNSLSWASDEVIDIWNDSNNITISNNIISEALRNAEHYKGPTSRGMLVGENTHSISLHHNLFAHNYSRNPALFNSGVNDIVNNIIYHWVSRGIEINSHTESNRTNIVKNLFIPLNSHDTPHPTNLNWHEILLKPDTNNGIETYFEDNWSTNKDINQNNPWAIIATDWSQQYDPTIGLHTNNRHWAPRITETPIAFLEDHILANVGATQPKRDATDMRIINDLENRTGNIKDCVQGCQYSGTGWHFPQ